MVPSSLPVDGMWLTKDNISVHSKVVSGFWARREIFLGSRNRISLGLLRYRLLCVLGSFWSKKMKSFIPGFFFTLLGY